jgi:hypothetical protein
MSARWQEYRPIHELTLFAASRQTLRYHQTGTNGRGKTNPQKSTKNPKNSGKRTKD